MKKHKFVELEKKEPSWVGPVSFIAGMAFVLFIEAFLKAI